VPPIFKNCLREKKSFLNARTFSEKEKKPGPIGN
jgi:hypothetical protein